jgi:hypothetical protein
MINAEAHQIPIHGKPERRREIRMAGLPGGDLGKTSIVTPDLDGVEISATLTRSASEGEFRSAVALERSF